MSDVDLEAIDTAIRHTIADSGVLEDTLSLASQFSVPHDQVVRVVKSLEATDTVAAEVITTKTLAATPLGARVASDNVSPEHAVASLVPYGADPGTPNAQLQAAPECAGSDGYRVCMKNGWLKAVRRPDLAPAPTAEEKAAAAAAEAADADADKGKKKKKEKDNVPVFVVRVVEDIGEDVVAAQMKAVVEGGAGAVDAAALKDLKKRKFVAEKTVKSFKLVAGPTFSRERKTLETDLTPEMLQSGAWRDAAFKPYNFKAMGRLGNVGHLHPLMKVRAAYRQVFLEMGYEEMPTDNFVESSFWNFDTLFQPQQHPARDAHDTFFVASPPPLKAPEDYIARVSDMHSKGGDGSIGWRYDWSREEASKTIMRTHTTAVSSRLLYKLAQEGFKPSKYFSIDRVFRNETPDATHLAEFHQIEGVVCDRNLSLADLIGTTKAFFERIGMTNLRFKPAYNPYTEPSMEIFAYHPELKKWTEVGNSGIFRPEMLRPMGLPEDVSCIAWGISLERPTMIRYGIPNIRALIGAKVDLGFVRGAPMFRL